MFKPDVVNIEVLKQRAYNLRWATVPPGVIPLTAADPDYPCAPEIVEAIINYSKKGYFCYGPADGLPAFKESMADFFSKKRSVPAVPELILPVDSAAFGIQLTCKAFLSPGDEALIFDPVDFLFRYSVETVGATAVPFAIPPGDQPIDFEQMERLISKNTKMICLCNPLNPTGKVFTRDELLAIGNIACKHNLIILSDEIWSDIIFRPNVFTSIASLNDEISERVITVTGFSKSYGLAGLRIGAVMAPNQKIYQQLFTASLHQSTIHGANTVAQVAAACALDKCGYWLQQFVDHLHAMRQLCVTQLNQTPGFSCIAPQGCYVAFADISGTGKTSVAVQQILFDTAKVAVVPGLKEWFGGGASNYIRLSFATSEEILTTALGRIKSTMYNI